MPWVEKYRPSGFKDVILDPKTKIILENILTTRYFPNLLLFGPPGIGKTTTILTMIREWNEQMGTQSNNCIHLNASDDRGINVIRNQIVQFVSCKSLFQNSLKFIILDEVDYMTRPAQEALYQLIQSRAFMKSDSIRYCLICNYLNRLDSNISSEMINIHFKELPRQHISDFLENIAAKETLSLPLGFVDTLIATYKTDIRSMINCMQTNQKELQQHQKIPLLMNVMTDDNYSSFLKSLFDNNNNNNNNNIEIFQLHCSLHNIDEKSMVTNICKFVFRNYKSMMLDSSFMVFVENIVHKRDKIAKHLYTRFFLEKLSCYINNHGIFQ